MTIYEFRKKYGIEAAMAAREANAEIDYVEYSTPDKIHHFTPAIGGVVYREYLTPIKDMPLFEQTPDVIEMVFIDAY